jgi:hypothetical protein
VTAAAACVRVLEVVRENARVVLVEAERPKAC